jgi:hypothetical protein
MTNDCVLRTAMTNERGTPFFVIGHAARSAHSFVMEKQ